LLLSLPPQPHLPRCADEESGYRQEDDDQGRNWDDVMSDDGEEDEEADVEGDESGAGAAKEAAEGKTGGADDDDENDATVVAARRKAKAMKQGVRMAAAVKRQLDALRGLAPGDFALIDCGWVSKSGGHAIMMAIERLADDAGAVDAAASAAAATAAATAAGVAAGDAAQAPVAATALPADLGTFTVTLCNTGAGVDHHPSSQHDYPKTKYRTALHLGRVPGWKLVDEYFIFNVVRCPAREAGRVAAARGAGVRAMWLKPRAVAVTMPSVDRYASAFLTLRGGVGTARVLLPSASEVPHGRFLSSRRFHVSSSPLSLPLCHPCRFAS
jgi:hypothetical protein